MFEARVGDLLAGRQYRASRQLRVRPLGIVNPEELPRRFALTERV
jgi:hypothetical protein